MTWLLIIIINTVPVTIPFTDEPSCQKTAQSIKTQFKMKKANHICVSSIYNPGR